MDPPYPGHHGQYAPYTPHFSMVPPYTSMARASRSKLSDNIIIDTQTGAFKSNPDITLIVRQEPKEALVLSPGKEKSRKPVDPPPILQLKVKDELEASQHFLQSPYLFLVVDLWHPTKNERWEDHGAQDGSFLYGGLSSSLHRLKDIDNKDGGFFIFGDISVRATGTFRLHFALYDLQKEHNAAVFIGSVLSQPFKVLLAKDYQGLEESTYLSRAFSDQGVRLRLRKEPRAFAGNKRSYFNSDGPASSVTGRAEPPVYDDDSPKHKRYRPDTEDRKENFADHTATTQPHFSSPYTSTPQVSYSVPSYVATIPQTAYVPSYTLPTNYNSNYAGVVAQSRYLSQPPSSSPYHQMRTMDSTSSYNVGPYPSSLNLGSMPPSNLPPPGGVQDAISQSGVIPYPDSRPEDHWSVPGVPNNWPHAQGGPGPGP